MYHHRIWYFPVMDVKRGEGGGEVHVSKERGGDIQNGEDEKRNGA